MSLSVFFSVRFSPAPEQGEWLNIAVVGESVEEQAAGAAYPESLARIADAFGPAAAERAQAVLQDLERLAHYLQERHRRNEPTRPIPLALQDLALSISLSEEVVVFEGTFDEALVEVARQYITGEIRTSRTGQARFVAEVPTGQIIPKTAAFFGDLLNRVGEAVKGLPTKPKRSERVLVIGGAGYVGSALLPRLLNHGYHVRLLDTMAHGESAIADLLDHPHLEVVKADFRLLSNVTEALTAVDAVVHLDPKDAGASQTAATHAIVKAAKAAGVRRFVYTSASSVYGRQAERVDEASKPDPLTPFALTKLASERLILSSAEPGFAPTVLRLGSLYGLSRQPGMEHELNRYVAQAVLHGRVDLGASSDRRAFVHVDDVAEAIVRTLDAPTSTVGNQIFNVGSETQTLTIAELAGLLRSAVPDLEITEAPAEADADDCVIGFSKLREGVGFEPDWTLEQGIEQVAEAIRQAQAELPDLQESASPRDNLDRATTNLEAAEETRFRLGPG